MFRRLILWIPAAAYIRFYSICNPAWRLAAFNWFFLSFQAIGHVLFCSCRSVPSCYYGILLRIVELCKQWQSSALLRVLLPKLQCLGWLILLILSSKGPLVFNHPRSFALIYSAGFFSSDYACLNCYSKYILFLIDVNFRSDLEKVCRAWTSCFSLAVYPLSSICISKLYTS